VAIFLGGLVAWAAGRRQADGHSRGVLLAAGLITGEALLGILLAIPIVLTGKEKPLGLEAGPFAWPGVLLVLSVLLVLYLVATRPPNKEQPHADR
jgi:hypothetical protein